METTHTDTTVHSVHPVHLIRAVRARPCASFRSTQSTSSVPVRVRPFGLFRPLGPFRSHSKEPT